MTPAEIVAQVLDNLERPDLESMAYANLNSALKSAHGIEVFMRDLVELPFDLSAYAVVSGAVGIPLPTRLRKILRIYTTDSAGAVVDETFIPKLNSVPRLKNYFGFTIENTYSVFGNTLNVKGMSANAANLNVQYAGYPELTFDALTSIWATDSWIAVEHPEIIIAYLQHRLATLVEDQNQVASAEKFIGLHRVELLRAYADEIVEYTQ